MCTTTITWVIILACCGTAAAAEPKAECPSTSEMQLKEVMDKVKNKKLSFIALVEGRALQTKGDVVENYVKYLNIYREFVPPFWTVYGWASGPVKFPAHCPQSKLLFGYKYVVGRCNKSAKSASFMNITQVVMITTTATL
ncbi:hypothetical protein ANCCAN_12612 [Ancylostoma caninum]|uniref:Uncharacterized protein n=1 Tax=Ancylostoma caninum TaxID=29170 RepID=A0A368GDV0_ANCCA|nr:hypothetical protein ANCCAN_12612 [Ancylostoma caninum]